ncbi:restriction endonuclease subunit S [Candidatus Electrothrix sp.]|uniref:restriction endonuclease subunit S n=1 Tax=Candidatus Electrothrix sp. TaxID=2170559 RepID=UPI004056EFAF
MRELPEGWKSKDVGEILQLLYGKPLPKEKRLTDGKFPAYGSNGIKCRTNEFYCDKASIIVGRKGSAGELRITEDKFWPLDVTYFVDFDRNKFDLAFLYHRLNALNLQSYAKGVKPGINRNDVYAIKCSFPSLTEQKRIVAILNEAFAGIDQAIANTEKNLTNAREVFESYLAQLSYEKKPLGIFVDIQTGKLNANAAVEGGKYPFFTCSRDHYAIDQFAFDCEAILLAGNNASGDFNVKHYSGKFNAYQRTYVITIKNDSQLLYRFLYFQLIKSLKELKKSSVGAGTKFLKLGMIKDLLISLPTIENQQKILNILDQLLEETQHLESIYQKKLTALAELKQSILQKAFTGELTQSPEQELAEVC